MRATEFITELFDTMPPYEIIEDRGNWFKVVTRLGDETITFEARIYDESLPMVGRPFDLSCWDIVFGATNINTPGRARFKATGTSLQFKVLPFVIQCTKMLVARNMGPDAYCFQAGTHEISKLRLYDHLAKRFANAKYIRLDKPHDRVHGFYVINKQYLKGAILSDNNINLNSDFDMNQLGELA